MFCFEANMSHIDDSCQYTFISLDSGKRFVSAEYKVILLVLLLCFLLCTNAPFDSLVFKVCICKSVFIDLNTCPLPSC